jgi:hypothetical protein
MMKAPQSFTVSGTQYYNTKDLKSYDPVYFHGTSRAIRKIVEKKKISEGDYLYASLSKKKGWTPAANQSKPPSKASLLLLKSWVETHIPKMTSENIQEEQDFKEAPGILGLDDEEKFHDNEGNVVEIETRGEREHDKVYFLAKDVATAFELPNLIKTIINKDRGYITGEDYTTLICKDFVNDEVTTYKLLFLTYEGMIKVLYTSRSGNAKAFRTWATKTLFTVQMGAADEKENLVSSMIGIPAKSLRQVLKTSTSNVPCVYTFALGLAKDLREEMKIPDTTPDDHIIIKYGYTDDLSRRTSEHIKTYESIKGVQLELMKYCYVDPKYLSEAETYIKNYFSDMEAFVKYKKFAEIVSFDPKHTRQLNQTFDNIQCKYSGCVKGLLQEVEDMRGEIVMLKEKHKWGLKDKDRELEIKDQIIATKDQTIITRDVELENARLKLQLLELKKSN